MVWDFSRIFGILPLPAGWAGHTVFVSYLFCAFWGDFMSGKIAKRLRSAAKVTVGTPDRPYHRIVSYLLVFAFGAVLAGGTALFVSAESTPVPPPMPVAKHARSLEQLLAMGPDQLAKVDIAEMNLLCAAGLPGSEGMDIDKCLAKLDQWAARVKEVTERHLYRLTDPRYKEHAEHFKHSEARFRAEWLMSTLQDDIGLHYHAGFAPPDKPAQPPKTSKEHFIHGLMDNDDPHKAFGGNCVSLPVAYIAVGRRLGYPVKLVCSKEHTFCRWEGGDHPNAKWRDRFNFDGAGNGFSIDPDEFYLSWPRKSTPEQVELCDWLKSLTPWQELAIFVAHRGHVLAKVSNDLPGALVAFSHSARLWPTSRSPLQEVAETFGQLWQRELAAHPETYRKLYGPQVAKGANKRGDPYDVDADIPTGRVPWWQTEAGRAANLAEVDRINEINRRNMLRMMPAVPQQQQPYGPQAPRPGVPNPYQPPQPQAPGQPPR